MLPGTGFLSSGGMRLSSNGAGFFASAFLLSELEDLDFLALFLDLEEEAEPSLVVLDVPSP